MRSNVRTLNGLWILFLLAFMFSNISAMYARDKKTDKEKNIVLDSIFYQRYLNGDPTPKEWEKFIQRHYDGSWTNFNDDMSTSLYAFPRYKLDTITNGWHIQLKLKPNGLLTAGGGHGVSALFLDNELLVTLEKQDSITKQFHTICKNKKIGENIDGVSIDMVTHNNVWLKIWTGFRAIPDDGSPKRMENFYGVEPRLYVLDNQGNIDNWYLFDSHDNYCRFYNNGFMKPTFFATKNKINELLFVLDNVRDKGDSVQVMNKIKKFCTPNAFEKIKKYSDWLANGYADVYYACEWNGDSVKAKLHFDDIQDKEPDYMGMVYMKLSKYDSSLGTSPTLYKKDMMREPKEFVTFTDYPMELMEERYNKEAPKLETITLAMELNNTMGDILLGGDTLSDVMISKVTEIPNNNIQLKKVKEENEDSIVYLHKKPYCLRYPILNEEFYAGESEYSYLDTMLVDCGLYSRVDDSKQYFNHMDGPPVVSRLVSGLYQRQNGILTVYFNSLRKNIVLSKLNEKGKLREQPLVAYASDSAFVFSPFEDGKLYYIHIDSLYVDTVNGDLLGDIQDFPWGISAMGNDYSSYNTGLHLSTPILLPYEYDQTKSIEENELYVLLALYSLNLNACPKTISDKFEGIREEYHLSPSTLKNFSFKSDKNRSSCDEDYNRWSLYYKNKKGKSIIIREDLERLISQ